MAATIRTMTLNVGTLSVPVALKTASEKKLPTFSTASPKGHKYERFLGNPEAAEASSLIETEEDRKAVEEELGTEVEAPGTEVRYIDKVTKDIFTEYEIARGVWEGETFYPIDKAQIEKIEELTKLDELSIQTFLPVTQVPWERVKGGYYLTPNKGAGLRALNLLREAMERTQTAGVALLCPKSRVHLAVIYPKHGGMMVATLSFAEEWAQVREGAASLSDPRGAPTEGELDMAVELVQALTTEDGSVLDEIGDMQAAMKLDLIEKAKMGEPLTEAERMQVADGESPEAALVAALRESVEQAKKSRKKKSPAKKNGRKASGRTTSRKKAAA